MANPSICHKLSHIPGVPGQTVTVSASHLNALLLFKALLMEVFSSSLHSNPLSKRFHLYASKCLPLLRHISPTVSYLGSIPFCSQTERSSHSGSSGNDTTGVTVIQPSLRSALLSRFQRVGIDSSRKLPQTKHRTKTEWLRKLIRNLPTC